MIDIFTIVLVGFSFLCCSHVIALLLGWHLGTKVNPEIYLSKPTVKTKSKPHEDEPDYIDQQRLDYD
mgnify:CR=1 FL=1